MRVSIPIKAKFGTFLNSKETVASLVKMIQNERATTVELDFNGVEFMSKTFAEQFNKEKLQLHFKGISVSLINVDEEITKTFSAVARVQNSTRYIPNQNDLHDLLFSA
jgi:anti-anti-sigma regulatory factor